MRRLAFLSVLAVAALCLVGCGVKSEPTAVEVTFPSHAVDAAGQTISLRAAPLRIVSLDAGATAILNDLGLSDATTTATVASARREVADPTTALVVVPLGLDPALLKSIVDATTAPVFHYGAVPLTTAPSAITQLGLAVGRGPEAAVIASSVAAGFRALAARLATAAPARVLIEGRGFTAMGPASPAGLAVAAAGGTNLVTTDQPINLADMTALAVTAWVALEPGGSTLTSLQGYPELAAVPAVRDGRVIPLPLAGVAVDAALPSALQALADDLRAAAVTPG
ncbi:MAG: ABC transporter substrate-binding protein [Thermoleophilia bacterium]|nr:ABC transporter substrate-binding protein [Thermoleophilia bacterium]